jgi:hypothetical protein
VQCVLRELPDTADHPAQPVGRPELILARATSRAGGQLTDPEPVTGLHRAFTGLGALEGHVIDSSTQTIGEPADAQANGLRAGRISLREPAAPQSLR